MDDKQVLIVEDEPGIREMLRFALERGHFRSAEAGDAAAAMCPHYDIVSVESCSERGDLFGG